MSANVPFKDWLNREMQDPEFREAMEELEPGYQVARLRMKRGLTQKELARLVSTRQSSISRLESGKSQPTISFLRRIAKALNAQIAFQLVSEEDLHGVIEKEDTVPAIKTEFPIELKRALVSACDRTLYSWETGPERSGVLQAQGQETWVLKGPDEASVCYASQWAVPQDRKLAEGLEWSDWTSGAKESKRVYQ